MLKNNLFNPEFFDHVSCNLCGADDTKTDILFDADPNKVPKSKKDLINIYSSSSTNIFYERVVRCKRCGLIYVSPRPKPQLIRDGYSLAEDKQYISQERARFLTFKNSIKTLKRLRDNGRLLDIGAASGTFVKTAIEAGYDACGVEPSAWMCEIAKKYYGVTILPAAVEEMKFPDNSFDIITMWDVLEHVCDPMNTLKEAARILRPQGLLLINYPRIDDVLARIFGRKWWFLLSVHLYYFTPKTLSLYIERLGFEKLGHRAHLQMLEYAYLVERLSVYSAALAKIARLPFIIPGFKKILIPYFASQYLMIARKKL